MTVEWTTSPIVVEWTAVDDPTISFTVQPASSVVAAGTGDMTAAVYDPTGVTDDAFDLANQTGVLDAGTFT